MGNIYRTWREPINLQGGSRMPYAVTPMDLPEVLLLQPKIFGDSRGFFYESFNEKDFASIVGETIVFRQDNHSRSTKGVLRGLHYQIRNAQGKLIRVTAGEVLDVAVDVRKSSPQFGKWMSTLLSADNKHQLWIPPGFAHGFLVVSNSADVLYKTTDYWQPEHERAIAWNDMDLGINWRLKEFGIEAAALSQKDAAGALFAAAEVYG